jgi:hypothetical protein
MNEKDNNHPSSSSSYVEPTSGNGLATKKGSKNMHQKCSLHVHSRTKTLADEDGRSIKACLDGIREAGLFEDDSPEFVKKVSQSQERTTGDEETIIEIIFEEEGQWWRKP